MEIRKEITSLIGVGEESTDQEIVDAVKKMTLALVHEGKSLNALEQMVKHLIASGDALDLAIKALLQEGRASGDEVERKRLIQGVVALQNLLELKSAFQAPKEQVADENTTTE